jgi:hypothetical protein
MTAINVGAPTVPQAWLADAMLQGNAIEPEAVPVINGAVMD